MTTRAQDDAGIVAALDTFVLADAESEETLDVMRAALYAAIDAWAQRERNPTTLRIGPMTESL